jgi:hypothetical protein
MTSSDVERMGKPPEKLKDYHDDQIEHSTCGGDEHGVSRQRRLCALHAQVAQKL